MGWSVRCGPAAPTSRATGGVRGLAAGVSRASGDLAWGGIKRLRRSRDRAGWPGVRGGRPGAGKPGPALRRAARASPYRMAGSARGTVANWDGVTRQRALLVREAALHTRQRGSVRCLPCPVRCPQPHRCARRAFWGLGARVQSFGRGHLLDRSGGGAPALPRARLGWPVAVLLGRRPEMRPTPSAAVPLSAPHNPSPPRRGLARPLSCPSRRWAHCIAREPHRTFVGMALSALLRAQACRCGRPAFAGGRSRSRLA